MMYLLVMVLGCTEYNTDAKFKDMEECLVAGKRLKQEALYEGEIAAKCVVLDEGE